MDEIYSCIFTPIYSKLVTLRKDYSMIKDLAIFNSYFSDVSSVKLSSTFTAYHLHHLSAVNRLRSIAQNSQKVFTIKASN